MSPEDYRLASRDLVQDTQKLLGPEYAQMLFGLPQLEKGTPVLKQFKGFIEMMYSSLSVIYGRMEIYHSLGGLLFISASAQLGATDGTVFRGWLVGNNVAFEYE